MNLAAARVLENIVRTGRPDLSPVIGTSSIAARISDGPYFVTFRESLTHVDLHNQADWIVYILDGEWHQHVKEVNAEKARVQAWQEKLRTSDTLTYLSTDAAEEMGGAAASCFCCGGPVQALLTLRTGYECFRGDWYLCLEHRYLNSENIRQNVVEV